MDGERENNKASKGEKEKIDSKEELTNDNSCIKGNFVQGVRNGELFSFVQNNQISKLKDMVNQYDVNVATLYDSCNNNLLHIAALYANADIILYLSSLCKNPIQLEYFINYRNRELINPAGMIFLNKNIDSAKKIRNAIHFAANPQYKISSFLKDKSHINCCSNIPICGTDLTYNVWLTAIMDYGNKETMDTLYKFFRVLHNRIDL